MGITVITGASTGLGAAMAALYAARGTAVALTARGADRLEVSAEACRAAGAPAVETVSLDVRDRGAVAAWIADLDARHGIDRVIANAGLNGGDPAGDLEAEDVAHAVIATNLLGALHATLPCIPLMRARGRGQIAYISSLAAFAPLPDAPAYSGTKAHLVAHGLALREKLRGTGVTVNVVCPGYIKTPMGGDYQGWRPLEMTPEAAAGHVVRGLERDLAVVAFPTLLAAAARGAALLPETLRRIGMGGFGFSIKDREGRD